MFDQFWMYGDDGRGPVTPGEMAELVKAGRVTSATLVAPRGSRNWGPAGAAFPELFSALAADPQATDVPPPVPLSAGAWTDRGAHPWRRFGARIIDQLVIGSVTWFAFGIALFTFAPEQSEGFFRLFDGPFGKVLDGMMTLLMAIPGQALMIGLTGLSLGKWIFGIRVLRNGRPIGLISAFVRELEVWSIGYGIGAPLISLFTLWSSKERLESEGKTRWDDLQDNTVTHRPWNTLQVVLAGVGLAIIFGGRIALLLLAAKPPS